MTKKRVIIISIAAIILVAPVILLLIENGKYIVSDEGQIYTYIYDLIGEDLSEITSDVEGMVYDKDGYNVVAFRLKTDQKMEQELSRILDEKCGRIKDISNKVVPNSIRKEYTKEIENGKAISVYSCVGFGPHGSSHVVEIWIVEREGNTYLYFIG